MNLLSVVMCSRDDARFARAAETYRRALGGTDHEIIRISDARSMCEGYNRGIAQARGDRLIFSHDDIEILNPSSFARRLEHHLRDFDLIGVAGTNRLIRGEWVAAGPPHIFGQVTQPDVKGGFLVRIFGAPAPAVGGIEAMDGLFIAARRSVFERVRFDEQTFDGFHFYDIDFTFAARRAGLRLGVCSDIHILHHSGGVQDERWVHYAVKFGQKYPAEVAAMESVAMRRCSVAWVAAATREEAAEIMEGICPGPVPGR